MGRSRRPDKLGAIQDGSDIIVNIQASSLTLQGYTISSRGSTRRRREPTPFSAEGFNIGQNLVIRRGFYASGVAVVVGREKTVEKNVNIVERTLWMYTDSHASSTLVINNIRDGTENIIKNGRGRGRGIVNQHLGTAHTHSRTHANPSKKTVSVDGTMIVLWTNGDSLESRSAAATLVAFAKQRNQPRHFTWPEGNWWIGVPMYYTTSASRSGHVPKVAWTYISSNNSQLRDRIDASIITTMLDTTPINIATIGLLLIVQLSTHTLQDRRFV